MDEWETSVKNQTGFTDAQNMMLLSKETHEGLRITRIMHNCVLKYMLIPKPATKLLSCTQSIHKAYSCNCQDTMQFNKLLLASLLLCTHL